MFKVNKNTRTISHPFLVFLLLTSNKQMLAGKCIKNKSQDKLRNTAKFIYRHDLKVCICESAIENMIFFLQMADLYSEKGLKPEVLTVLKDVFHICDIEKTGSVTVSKLIMYLKEKATGTEVIYTMVCFELDFTILKSFLGQPHKMVKLTQTIRLNCLSVFDHLVGLALKGLIKKTFLQILGYSILVNVKSSCVIRLSQNKWIYYCTFQVRSLVLIKTCHPTGIYLLKFNSGITIKMFKVCSKLKVKTPKRRHLLGFGVFILTLNRFYTFFLLLTLNR